jgi:hypothetical protein
LLDGYGETELEEGPGALRERGERDGVDGA